MLSGHIGHPKKAAILTDKGRQAMDTRANLPEGPGLPYRREESPVQELSRHTPFHDAEEAARRSHVIRIAKGLSFRRIEAPGKGTGRSAAGPWP